MCKGVASFIMYPVMDLMQKWAYFLLVQTPQYAISAVVLDTFQSP